MCAYLWLIWSVIDIQWLFHFSLTPEDVAEDVLISLKFVKFQYVQSVTVSTYIYAVFANQGQWSLRNINEANAQLLENFYVTPVKRIHTLLWLQMLGKTLQLVSTTNLQLFDYGNLILKQLFVKDNQGNAETTTINSLSFIGATVESTNMNDFKKVRI